MSTPLPPLSAQNVALLQDAVYRGQQAASAAAEHWDYAPQQVRIEAPYCHHNAGWYFLMGYSIGRLSGPGYHGGWGGWGRCGGGGGGNDDPRGILGAILLVAAAAVAVASAVFAGFSVYNGGRAIQFQYRMHQCSNGQEKIAAAGLDAELADRVQSIYNQAHAINKGLYAKKVCYAVSNGAVAAGLGLISATIVLVALTALHKIKAPGFNLWCLAAPGLALTTLGTAGLITTACCSSLFLRRHGMTKEDSEQEIEDLQRECVQIINAYPDQILTQDFREDLGLPSD